VNLASVSIARPVMTLMVVALIASLGLVSLANSSTDLLPEIALPVVAVVTSYSGAGAREVEALITRPIEQALGYVGGVGRISSVSAEGRSTVTAEFGWGTNLDAAVLDVRDSIELVKPWLPEGAGNPRVVKADLSTLPVMRIALSGPYDMVELTRMAETVRSRLERIEGVASAGVGGGAYEEARVEVHPAKLLAYGLTVPGIAGVLRAENLNLPGGRIDEHGKRLVLRTEGQFRTVADIAGVALSTPTGAVVKLGDVASVSIERTEAASTTRVNGEPAVTLSVRKQSGTNTVQIAAHARDALAAVMKELPAGAKARIIQDQSDFINRALGEVTSNILVGGLLAIIVLFLFLAELRTVAVIAMAIPVSILATFAFMYFAKMTLNLVSLGGLALGVGMLVDNAIVILENIYRHRESGLEPRAAAARGTQEVAMAVTASTLTTVVVFVPVVFVTGLASQIFRQLALTVSFSLSSSLFVALTFVPMAAALLMRRAPGKPGKLALASDRVQQGMTNRYRGLLFGSLRRRGLLMVAVALLVLMAGGVYLYMPRSLLPAMDQREITVAAMMARGTSGWVSDAIMQQVELIAMSRDDVDFVFAGSGGGGATSFFSAGGADSGEALIRLLPQTRGRRTTAQVAAELRRALAEVPGARFQVSSRSSIVGEDRAFGAPLVISVRGDGLVQLTAAGDQIAELMRTVPGVVNVRSTLEQAEPELQVNVDRARAAQVGLGGAQIGGLLRAAVEGQVATTFRWQDRDVDIRVIYPKDSRSEAADIRSLLLQSPSGRLVRLDEVAEVSLRAGPTSISRRDGARIAQVQADLAGIDLDTAMARVRATLGPAVSLPEGYSIEYGGESQEIGRAFGSLGQSFIMAAALVYMVMAAQFESVRQPLIIMVTVPLALAGAVVAMALTGQALSTPAIVGLIALTGVVVNNGIVLVDYANQLRQQGLAVREALLEAGAVRLRPILMTSLTTIFALLPMALTSGEGSEMLTSLSMPLLGGLVFSTFLTLFVVPALYTVAEWRPRRLASRDAVAHAPGPAPADAVAHAPGPAPADAVAVLAAPAVAAPAVGAAPGPAAHDLGGTHPSGSSKEA
jgi:HAE1 family hydrophobic/amphiphilic exporter-1